MLVNIVFATHAATVAIQWREGQSTLSSCSDGVAALRDGYEIPATGEIAVYDTPWRYQHLLGLVSPSHPTESHIQLTTGRRVVVCIYLIILPCVEYLLAIRDPK